MVDYDAGTWMWAVLAALLFGGVLYWLIRIASTGRLMRCPETGAVVFVDVKPAPPGTSKADVIVQGCDFCPEKKDCGQGCLVRYGESKAGIRVNLDALRPFEPK